MLVWAIHKQLKLRVKDKLNGNVWAIHKQLKLRIKDKDKLNVSVSYTQTFSTIHRIFTSVLKCWAMASLIAENYKKQHFIINTAWQQIFSFKEEELQEIACKQINNTNVVVLQEIAYTQIFNINTRELHEIACNNGCKKHNLNK